MINIKYYIAAACLLSVAMVGCETSDVDGGTTPKGEVVDISVQLSVESDGSQEANAGSRVSVVPEATASNTGEWVMSWETGDTVLGICDDGYSDEFSISEFVGSDTDKAIFEGTATSGTKMRFIYPYSDSAYADGTYKIDVASQTVRVYDSADDPTDNAYTHFADNNLYMISDVIDVDNAESATPLMSHLLSAFELVFTLNSSTFEYETSGSSVASNSIKIKSFQIYNLSPKTTEITPTTNWASYDVNPSYTSGTSLTLTLDEAIVVNIGETVVVPFAVIPYTFNSSTNIKINVTMDASYWYNSENGNASYLGWVSSGATGSVEKTGAIAAGTTIVAGTHNVLNCRVSMSTEKGNGYVGQIPDLPTFTLLADTNPADAIIASAEADGFTATSDEKGNLVISSSTISSADDFDDIKTLSDAAEDAGLTIELTLDNIKSVGGIMDASGDYDFAFTGCTALTSVSLPDCTEIFASSVFDGCTNLTEVYLGSSSNSTTTYTTAATWDGVDTTAITLYVYNAGGVGSATYYNVDDNTAYYYTLDLSAPEGYAVTGSVQFADIVILTE